MNNLVIFSSNINNGPFSLNRDYYPNNYSFDDIKNNYKERLDDLSLKYGFNSSKLIKPIQKGQDTFETCLEVDDNLYVHHNLWSKTFYYDMVLLDKKYRCLPVGCAIADCPLVICYDKSNNKAIIAHCGALEINRYLPVVMAQKLIDNGNFDIKDINVFISSCIDYRSYTYDCYPSFATNYDVWQNSIVKEKDGYSINLRKAIYEQLINFGILLDNIHFDGRNTFTDSTLYSNRAYKCGNERKKGRYLVGCFFD